MADTARRRAAERKEFGNRVYEKGKLGAALDAYTEAIALDPTWAVPLVNRAIVHRMRAEWRDVQADCEKALGLDRDNMKARYLLGLALMEMDGDAQVAPATSDDSAPSTRACRELQIAYELAREKGAQLKDDVWRALARAKYRAYANAAKHRTARRRELQARIVAMLDASDGAGGADAAELVSVFADAAKATGDGTADEAPEWATCVLTYDIMRDPVVTPSGLSYVRRLAARPCTRRVAASPYTPYPFLPAGTSAARSWTTSNETAGIPSPASLATSSRCTRTSRSALPLRTTSNHTRRCTARLRTSRSRWLRVVVRSHVLYTHYSYST